MNYDGVSIAESIDVYCEQKHMTKAEFQAGADVSSGSISQWRTGRHNPSRKNVRTIEEFVQMPIDQFVAIYKKMPAAGSSELSDEAREFINLFSAASPAMREAVLATLRAAAAQAEAAQDVQAVSE